MKPFRDLFAVHWAMRTVCLRRQRRASAVHGAALLGAALLTVLAGATVVACGGKPSKYPAREDGCEVTVYPNQPAGRTENIGPVSASCEESVSEADCIRTLKDQVCNLGGDLVWGVGDRPTKNGLRYEWHGRAAHTRAPRESAPDAPASAPTDAPPTDAPASAPPTDAPSSDAP